MRERRLLKILGEELLTTKLMKIGNEGRRLLKILGEGLLTTNEDRQ